MIVVTAFSDIAYRRLPPLEGKYGWDCPVTVNRETVLKLLREELAFVESGGYRRSPHSPWRSARIFEDSPSCPNYGVRTHHHRCVDCWLMTYLDSDLHLEHAPCRFVRIAGNGLTVESLYRCGTTFEIEEILRIWLRDRITELERDLAELRLSTPPFPHERTLPR